MHLVKSDFAIWTLDIVAENFLSWPFFGSQQVFVKKLLMTANTNKLQIDRFLKQFVRLLDCLT